MGKGRDSFGLALEPGERVGILGEVGRQHLDGDVAIEPRVARAVDLAHSAGAQRSQDRVWAEACTRRQRHGWRRQL